VRHRVRAHLGEKQRVAVRLLAGHRGGGDGAAGARPVLHHQGLAVGDLGKAVGEVARQRIGGTAGADRHQQPHRALGPLRRRLGRDRRGEQSREQGGKPEAGARNHA
jgi:hypothetical protein